MLRVTPGTEDFDSTRAILEWLSYLDRHGAPVAAPVDSVNGLLLEAVEAEDGAKAVAVAYQKAEGTVAEDLPPDSWSAQLFYDLGRASGKMHALATEYQARDRRRPLWNETVCEYVAEEYLPEPDPGVEAKNRELIAYLDALPTGTQVYGSPTMICTWPTSVLGTAA